MIQTEIDRIEDGKAFVRAAIIDKTGGSVPSEYQSLDDYATIISNIDLGGEMTEEVRKIVNRTATSIVVPSTVTELRTACFYNCTLLQEIVMFPTTPPIQGTKWCENTNDCTIYVPDASLETYQNAWTNLTSRIQPLSGRTMTYDFGNATVDNEAIPTYHNKTRVIRYQSQRLTTWMTTEYDGLYLSGTTYDDIYWSKRNKNNATTIINGIYNKAPGSRWFSIDTKGYNTITFHNGNSSILWTASTFPSINNGTITVANDGMSATITVNQGATYVDVLAARLFGTISSMVFTM